jgi:hypothetical protein
VLEVLGQVHGRHAALAQLTLEAVAVGEGGQESRVEGHKSRETRDERRESRIEE